MAIDYEDNAAVFHGVVGAEHAETLLAWLQGRAAARVDLAACTHLHPANLQVLMAGRPAVAAWPSDPALARWLQSALPYAPPAGQVG